MPDPDDEDPHKEQKPKLLYEGASYHGKEKQGAKNSAPTRGQRALEDSFDLGSNTDRRVGYDFDNDEIIVFDKTLGNKYHGHVRSWEELEQKMKNVLQKNDIFDHRGRVKGS